MEPLTLAILISGRGSNMEALIKACADPAFPARAAVVIANNPGAEGLAKAQAAGVDTAVVDYRAYEDKRGFEQGLTQALEGRGIDLICLAGFMRLLSAEFISGWENRIINIHPSLLPAYKGLNVHERVLADGAEESGCTVHYVIPEMDAGPAIVQRAVPVMPEDTPGTLAARILAQEHIAYPEAVRLIAESRRERLDVQAKIL